MFENVTRSVSRPILIGGLSLSAGLALWESVSHWGEAAGTGDHFSSIALCALGAGALLWRRQTTIPAPWEPLSDDRQGAVDAIARLGVAIERLDAELHRTDIPSDIEPADTLVDIQGAIAQWRSQQETLTAALKRQTLTVAIVGAPQVGKSTIVAQLAESTGAVQWDEITRRATRPIIHRMTGEITGQITGQISGQTSETSSPPDLHPDLRRALLADCVLYVIAGDITASDRRDLERLHDAGQTPIVVWNKSDLVSAADRDRVLGSIRQQLADLVAGDRVVAIAAAPRGATTADLGALPTMLQAILAAPHPHIWRQIQRACRLTIADLQPALNRLRRQRAELIVRRYQWVAAAAVAANPIPSLDLLASGSVGAQLLVELSPVYRRELSFERARAGFEAIVEMLLKLGVVELSTQAIAGLLKHNPITFLAGSAVQGLSAAYWVHIIGVSAIAYFETQDTETFEFNTSETSRDSDVATPSPIEWDSSRWQAILSQTIARTQRTAFLQGLLNQAQQHFGSASVTQPAETAEV